MANRKPRSKSKEPSGNRPLIQLDPERWEEITAIGILILAALTALGAFDLGSGLLLGPWVGLLQGLLGWGVYLAPLILAGLGVWLFLDALDRTAQVGWERPIAIGIGFLLLLSVLHWVSVLENPLQMPGPFQGGGVVGWLVVSILIQALGAIGALLALLALASVALILLFNVSLPEILRRAGRLALALRHADEELRRLLLRRKVQPPPFAASTPAASARPAPAPVAPSAPLPERSQEMLKPAPTKAEAPGTPSRGAAVARLVGGRPGPASIPIFPEYRLPVVDDILEEGTELEVSPEEIRNKVRVIEETLQHFAVPAKVLEVNQGPTITQFGVEPGFIEQRGFDGRIHRVKVKVSRISALQHDLELALAAAPVRIEAPVPGRNVVGIEVPNSQVGLVSLRSVIDSDAFKTLKSKLRLALGQDVAGQPICDELVKMPHLLIAGATGSGKSVCINSIIATLLCTTTPQDVRFTMIDPKRVELVNFNPIPHLLKPVVVEVEGAVQALKDAVQEMDGRFKLFAQKGARNIDVYNEMVGGQPGARLPYHVVIVDELADLMMVAADEVERAVTRLAQMARATGIHLILATQRPSVDVVTGLIKANFPARISFAVTSQIDSRVVLDAPGAEKLLGRGDMLYMASDSSKLLRLQGCFVSDRELDKLTSYWKAFGPAPTPPGPAPGPRGESSGASESLPGTTSRASDEELLGQAIDVLRQNKRASISLLQRKLRIGYSRAARLIEILEERGLVGPDEGPTRGRSVLVQDQPAGGQAPSREFEDDDLTRWTEEDWSELDKD